jgi:hypothetical protein
MKKWLVNCISEDGEFTIELVEAESMIIRDGVLSFFGKDGAHQTAYSPSGWFNVRPFEEDTK